MNKQLLKTIIIGLVLILPGWAFGAIHYVTETGAGDNDGTSHANAESLSDFNGGSFGELDDDTVYFCDTIRGMVTIPDSGTSGHVATFKGDYADHAGIIYGSIEKNDAGDWTDEGGDDWYASSITVDPNVVWRDGSRMTEVAAKVDLSEDGEWWWDDPNDRLYVWDTDNPTTGSQTYEIPQRDHAITATDKDYITVDGLSLKYCNNDIIEVSYSASDLTDWTIQNCAISGCWVHGAAIQGAASHNSDNIYIINNTVADWGGTTTGGQGAAGIWLQYIDYFDIHSNTITGNADTPVGYTYHRAINVHTTGASDLDSCIYQNTINGTITGSNSAGIMFEIVYYVDVYDNDISGSIPMGIWSDASGIPLTCDGSFYCKIYNNHIHNSGSTATRGILLEATYQDEVYNNVIDLSGSTYANPWGVWFGSGNSVDKSCDDASSVFYNNTVITNGAGICLQLSWDGYDEYLKNMTIKNNILYYDGTGGAMLLVGKEDGGTENGHVFDYNHYYDAGAANPHISWFGTDYASLAAFVAAETHEDHGVESDPLFVDVSGNDFTLKLSSPCRNAATYLSGYEAKLDPTSSWPDDVRTRDDILSIGAYAVNRGAAGM